MGFWGEGRGAEVPPPSPKLPSPTPYRGMGGEFEGRAGTLAYEKSPGPSPQLFFPTRSGPAVMGLPVAAAMDRSMPW